MGFITFALIAVMAGVYGQEIVDGTRFAYRGEVIEMPVMDANPDTSDTIKVEGYWNSITIVYDVSAMNSDTVLVYLEGTMFATADTSHTVWASLDSEPVTLIAANGDSGACLIGYDRLASVRYIRLRKVGSADIKPYGFIGRN